MDKLHQQNITSEQHKIIGQALREARNAVESSQREVAGWLDMKPLHKYCLCEDGEEDPNEVLVKLMEALLERNKAYKVAGRAFLECGKALKDAKVLSDRLTALELECIQELARLQRERDEAREVAKEADAGHDMAIADLAKCEVAADKVVLHAKELIARWDQPSWKDSAPTAGYIYALRDAVEAYEKGNGVPINTEIANK